MLIKNAKLNWVSIKQPNQMSGKYQTDFYLDKQSEDALIAQLDSLWEEHKGTFKGAPQSLGYSALTDEDGVETGEIKFKAVQAPKSPDGQYTFEVKVYDSKAKLINKEDVPNIGNGTIANLDISFYPYTYQKNKGIRINLNGIQILKLEEYSSGPSFSEDDSGSFQSENTFVSQSSLDL